MPSVHLQVANWVSIDECIYIDIEMQLLENGIPL